MVSSSGHECYLFGVSAAAAAAAAAAAVAAPTCHWVYDYRALFLLLL